MHLQCCECRQVYESDNMVICANGAEGIFTYCMDCAHK